MIMIVFSCKTFSQIITTLGRYRKIPLCDLQIPFPKSFSNLSESTNSASLVIDYLINSCGLSPETALSASKKIRADFATTEKPDSILTFLETTGFSKTHITKLISAKPNILCSDLNKTLKPKIKLFQDLGLSGFKLAELIASNPNILHRSLKRQIIPSLQFIRGFFGTDENVIRAVKRAQRLFCAAPELRMQPNIALLQDHNIPDSRITHLILNQPGILMLKKELGFKPETGLFTTAIHIVCSMSRSTWDAKIKLLKDLGWSEEQVFIAFKKQPILLSLSAKKIKQGMEFFAEMLNWNVTVISRYPNLLTYSLKERVIPRFRVYQILKLKELVREEKTLVTMLCFSEKDFLEKYVIKYQEKLPDLLKAYKC